VSVALGWGPADFEAAELMSLGEVIEEAIRLKTPPEQ